VNNHEVNQTAPGIRIQERYIMVELRIFDLRDDNKALINFSDFLNMIKFLFNDFINNEWEIFKGAYGYGEKICEIEDKLENKNSIKINAKELLPYISNEQQYFDNAKIRVNNLNMEFGIHDSTFYFIRGDLDLLNNLSIKFKNTQVVNIKDES